MPYLFAPSTKENKREAATTFVPHCNRQQASLENTREILCGGCGLEFSVWWHEVQGAHELKANPPPEKGSWRRSGAAPATTKAPYKHRAAKHEAAGAKPALPTATPNSSHLGLTRGARQSPFRGGPAKEEG